MAAAFGIVGQVVTSVVASVSPLVGGVSAGSFQLDTSCRGSEGANDLSVCDERTKVGRQIKDIGWCYGKVGEVGYQHEWHQCGPLSIRSKR